MASWLSLVARGLLVAASAFAMAHAQASAAAAQTGDPPAPQRVKSASELQPGSADEQARAAHFAGQRTSDMTVAELVELGGGGLRLRPRVEDALLPFLPVICFGSRPASQACAVADSPDSMVRLEATLRGRVCAADTVVVARVASQKAMLTKGEMALFTDYVVEPERWLRPATGPSSLVISEWGGSVEIAGKPFAIVRPALMLQAGKRYILVLAPSRETNGFVLKADPIELATAGPAAALSGDFAAQVTKAAAQCKA